MRCALSVTMVALLSTTSIAEEEFGTIAGAGWVSCAEYAEKYQRDPKGTEEYFYAWAQGYMSGVNQVSLIRKNLRGWSITKQKDHIRAFCDQRPLANVVIAIQDLFDQLPSR